jgi:hypothetical protein
VQKQHTLPGPETVREIVAVSETKHGTTVGVGHSERRCDLCAHWDEKFGRRIKRKWEHDLGTCMLRLVKISAAAHCNQFLKRP